MKHTPSLSKFKAKLNKKLVVDWKAVLDVVNTGSAQIADARSSGRFMGTVITSFSYRHMCHL